MCSEMLKEHCRVQTGLQHICAPAEHAVTYRLTTGQNNLQAIAPVKQTVKDTSD